jgi:hypothetical protein
MDILIKICPILLYETQNESQFKRNIYILITFIGIVYIVMSTVGIVKGVQNYGIHKKE